MNCDEGTNAVFLPLRKKLQSAIKLVFYSYREKVCAELTAHLQRAAGFEKGLSGLVVFMQRFAIAENLNIYFHIIALDGVYEKKSTGHLKFYATQAPSNETIQNLVGHISTKINNLLIKKG